MHNHSTENEFSAAANRRAYEIAHASAEARNAIAALEKRAEAERRRIEDDRREDLRRAQEEILRERESQRRSYKPPGLRPAPLDRKTLEERAARRVEELNAMRFALIKQRLHDEVEAILRVERKRNPRLQEERDSAQSLRTAKHRDREATRVHDRDDGRDR